MVDEQLPFTNRRAARSPPQAIPPPDPNQVQRPGSRNMADKRPPSKPEREVGIQTRSKPKTKKPSLYRVLLLNDDYTPMEFVVLVLEHFFNKSREEATRIMLHVHNTGVGVCGVFPLDVAETKVAQVMDLARQQQHPLQCTKERED
jgi:ATP-dependent Clp protease adaptor protein ClpS